MLCLLVACSSAPVNNQPADNKPANNASANTPAPQPEPEPAPAPTPAELGFVITTGVHGNEPSGYLIQDQLIKLGFRVFGPCNEWGIANNSRYLESGDDLNRMFGRADCPQAEAVKKFLAENPPKILFDLHEDPDGTGAYLIQHGPDDEIGRKIIDALKADFEFDPEPSFMVVKGQDGLLKPTIQQLRALKFIGVYGLAYHAWYTHGCTSIVVECPGSWPEEKRKAYQLRVCELAWKFFRG